MLFRWFKNRRRRALLAQPFPNDWLTIIEQNMRAHAALSDDEQARVRDYVRIFTAEKNWEGCGGFAMTDEVRVTIAAQTALLVLGLGEQYFDHVLSILVYPTAYVARDKKTNPWGIVTEGDSARLGEAWYRGPVIFSWNDVLAGGRGETYGNVVYHEFAHQLDMLNGHNVDGTPPLDAREQDERWKQVMRESYRRLRQACRRGEAGPIDCYGATSPAEFFAVATETFFAHAGALAEHDRELFDLLSGYYKQDPRRFDGVVEQPE